MIGKKSMSLNPHIRPFFSFPSRAFAAAVLLLLSMAIPAILHADSGFFQIKDTIPHFKQTNPVLGVKLQTQENIYGSNSYVKGYFFDRDGKLIHSYSAPVNMPVLFKKEEAPEVFFALLKGLSASDCQAVFVFGDTNEAVATTYPQTLSASSFNYPEKKLVDNPFHKEIKRKIAIDPLVEYVVKSAAGKPRHPQLTLFLRMPKGVSSSAEIQGVMVICILWNAIGNVRAEMQKPEMSGDYKGLFSYANAHKLAIIAWGGAGFGWDARKNYNEMDKNAFQGMEANLDEVADTWEKGILELSETYGIPKKDFLLWGVCASAQWAHRLCLRKPDYFLATYLLIPSSFDKPTPEASKVLWCLCTGERFGGYVNALKWYDECQYMGYPMMFKAYEGMGHEVHNRQALNMAFKFFDFALTQKDLRDQYDKNMSDALSHRQMEASGQLQGPWPEIFKHPPYYGDIVNQELYPADQVEMIPTGFRTPLPTKELADYWNTGR